MAKSNSQGSITREEILIATTFRVSLSLWKRLRALATEERVSQQEIWIKAADKLLKEKGF